jgi:hypothetical protein
LSEAKKEILDEVDKKYHSRSWEYLVDEVVHNFLDGKRLKMKKNHLYFVISDPDVDGNVCLAEA